MQTKGKYPRSFWPLLVIMVVAVLGFVFLRDDDQNSEFTLGGLLFPVTADDIMVMHLTKGNAEYRFERLGNHGWSLSGDVSDFTDDRAMVNLVSFLTSVQGGSVLPGTTAEDRRYGFNGNESIRLAVFATEGREFRLSLGVENPVTGGVYASGVGRSGCFPVGQGLRNKLRALPVSVQEKNILPQFDLTALTEVEVWRGSEQLILKPFAHRWWIREPEDGMAQLGLAFRKYNAIYNERRVIRDGQPWLLAEPRAVEKLFHDATQLLVRDIISPADTPEQMEEWSMDPPWRQVVFHGPGINIDPKAGSADELSLSYGPPLENDYVPFMRQGNLMLADKSASIMLSEPLGQWLDTGALPFRIEVGDSLRIEKEGRWMLSAHPGLDEDISRWLGQYSPNAGSEVLDPGNQNSIESLIVDLDRLEILQVLSPSDKAWVLKDTERVQMSFWTSKTSGSGQQNIEFGWLDLDHLPGGDVARARKLAEEGDGQAPAGMWVPATGQLLQIPAHLVIRFRNLDNH